MSIARENIVDIIKAGCMAPSGDNSQPWRFVVRGDEIDVINLPERDNPILNYLQRGSYLAHGCVIENMVLAASSHGIGVTITLFPDPQRETVVAKLSLKGTVSQHHLAKSISQRHTNRRVYDATPITEEQRIALKKSGGFDLIENTDARKKIAAAAAHIEQVILEDQRLHGLLFKDIVWNKMEEGERHSGFYIPTMEFTPPQRFLFGLASHEPIMKIFRMIGLPSFIVAQDSKLYATGAAIGIISIPENTAEHFVNAGRLMERIWLTATSLGLSFQPVMALFFAHLRLQEEVDTLFQHRHVAIIQKNYDIVKGVIGLERGHIASFFRIGNAKPPSATSSRKDPDIIFQNAS